jgi:hypothetical protein
MTTMTEQEAIRVLRAAFEANPDLHFLNFARYYPGSIDSEYSYRATASAWAAWKACAAVKAFACSERAKAPNDETAACRQWCGEQQCSTASNPQPKE